MGNNWLKYNPTSGEVSAGGLGLWLLVGLIIIVGIGYYANIIVGFLLVVAAIIFVILLVFVLYEYLSSRNQYGGGII